MLRLCVATAGVAWFLPSLPAWAGSVVRVPARPVPAAGAQAAGLTLTLPSLGSGPGLSAVPNGGLRAPSLVSLSAAPQALGLPVPVSVLPEAPAVQAPVLPAPQAPGAPAAAAMSGAVLADMARLPLAAEPGARDADLKAAADKSFDGARPSDGDAPEPGQDPAGLRAEVLGILDRGPDPGAVLYGDDIAALAAQARIPESRFVAVLMDAGRLVRFTDGTRFHVKFSKAVREAAARVSATQDAGAAAKAVRLFNGGAPAGHAQAAVFFNKLALALVKTPASSRDKEVVLPLALNSTLLVLQDILSEPGMADGAGLRDALAWVRKNHFASFGRMPSMPDDDRDAVRELLRSGKASPLYVAVQPFLMSFLGEEEDGAPAGKPSPKTPASRPGSKPAPRADAKKDPVEVLRERIERSGMPAGTREHALAELERLARYRQGDAEGQKLETYLDWLTGLPWAERTEDSIDLARAGAILDERHAGLAEVKERILEFLALRKRTGSKKGAIICFTGPPGVGKTSIASAIAESMGRRFVRLSLGGVNDETELRGHGRTYLGSQPGGIIRKMKEAGTVNPVMLLDEVDKLGQEGSKGDPTAALLEILDPAQNDTFRDRYMDVPYDLSEVLFIATANELDRIPAPLRDRMEIIEFSGYTMLEKVGIAQRHIVDEMRRQSGLTPEEARLSDEAVRAIIEGYTREAGVRTLRERIATLMRRVAAWMETKGLPAPGLLGAEGVEKYLGVPRYSSREAAPNDVGVATALAVSGLGGTAFNVEVVAYPGSGVLRLRRQMLEMIDDSAHNVYAYLRTVAGMLGIPEEKFRSVDIEIAFTPAGPIDGPSAGVTMAAAMASRLSGRKVKDGIAMTGEITLTGRVLPIGGLKQKVMAAHRAGYRTVIFPEANLRDVESIPEEVRGDMRLIPVRHIDQVFAEALEPLPSPG